MFFQHDVGIRNWKFIRRLMAAANQFKLNLCWQVAARESVWNTQSFKSNNSYLYRDKVSDLKKLALEFLNSLHKKYAFILRIATGRPNFALIARLASCQVLSLASPVSTPNSTATRAVLEPTFEGRGWVISAQKEFDEHNIRLKVINRQSRVLKF